MYFRIETNSGPAYYVVGVNDGYGINQSEASAIARAVGNSNGRYPDGSAVFRRITGSQATLILERVKAMRTRHYQAIAKAVGRELGDELREINADIDTALAEVRALAKNDPVAEVVPDSPDGEAQ